MRRLIKRICLSACPGPLPLLAIIPTGKVMAFSKTLIPVWPVKVPGDHSCSPASRSSHHEASHSLHLFEVGLGFLFK